LDGKRIDGTVDGAHFVQNFTVNSLIEDTTKRWNEQIIRQVFSPYIASSILHTPLFSQVQHDRLIWKAEKNGRYSVRSAYRLCVDELIDVSYLRRPGYWSGIWRLEVPPKVKNLIWRVCHGVLPTRARLCDKGVQCPTSSVHCLAENEDTAHLLIDCPAVVQVWQVSGLWQDIQQAKTHENSAINVVFYLLQHLTVEQSQRFAVTIWSIWKRRNLKVWENKDELCAMTVDRAHIMIEEWQQACEVRTGAHQIGTATAPILQQHNTDAQLPATRVSWQRPPRGRFKCNVDAGFSTIMNRTGIGICIRGDDGAFVLAKTITFEVVHSVHVGEALGLYHAMEWLSDMQLNNVDFETDSKTTHDAFHAHKDDVSEFGHIISACRSLFNNHLTNSRVEFTRRQTNEVAHALAGEATLSTSPIIYFNAPHCINNIIFNEML